MPWYYNTSSGELTLQKGTLAKITGFLNTHTPGLGWHELNGVPESDTFAQAAAAAEKMFPGAATPTSSTGTATKQQIGSEVAGNPNLFHGLNLSTWFIRIGQILVGLVLLAAGLARITHAVPAATRVAAAVGTRGLA